MKNIVAIVDPFSSGKLIASRLHEQGFGTIAIISNSDTLATFGDSFVGSDFSKIYYFDGNINFLSDEMSFLGVKKIIPGAESGVTLADTLSNIFSPEISNAYNCTHARRDKMEMVDALQSHSLRAIKSIKTDNLKIVEQWLSENPNISRLVVKPLESAGTDSVGIFKIDEDWRNHAKNILGTKDKLGHVNYALLFQEYIQGVEYVVDSFSWHGKHYIKNVCRYKKIRNGAHEAVYSSLEFLDKSIPQYKILREYIYNVLDALGISYGAAHSEVIIDDKGPVLVETGARLHGGGHPIYAEMCTGQSQLTDLIHAYTEDEAQFGDYDYMKHVNIIFIVAESAGVLNENFFMQKLEFLKNAKEIKLLKNPGDCVHETSDLYSILGFVVLSGDDLSSIVADEAKIRMWEKNIVAITK
ncbi:ATP-grasp domain-containing protein [Kushneria aurantia]|uniref:ATP-grasp domain-containing protein n=1 Tax=Kushneria aurantia TaxID=504092 RepID=A0ABV6G3A2_9GAMM|nr:ATP-grasp domain-containing protein [Kushneria aurantia]